MGNGQMMGADFYFRPKIPIALLGVTGWVGQKLVQRLAHHPWFEVIALCDVEPFVGQCYGEAVTWQLPSPLPDRMASMRIQACTPSIPCSLVLSGLVSCALDRAFAEAGYPIVSPSFDLPRSDVPLVVAQVNPDHLALLKRQSFPKGKIINTPSSPILALALALKPLKDQFGLKAIQAVMIQSVNSKENVFFGAHGEEEIEQQLLNILGNYQDEKLQRAPCKISAQSIHLSHLEGILLCLSVKLRHRASLEQIHQAWRQLKEKNVQQQLPTTPFLTLHDVLPSSPPKDLTFNDFINISHLRVCPHLDYKFNLTCPHLWQGVAEAILLNGETLVTQGHIYW